MQMCLFKYNEVYTFMWTTNANNKSTDFFLNLGTFTLLSYYNIIYNNGVYIL